MQAPVLSWVWARNCFIIENLLSSRARNVYHALMLSFRCVQLEPLLLLYIRLKFSLYFIVQRCIINKITSWSFFFHFYQSLPLLLRKPEGWLRSVSLQALSFVFSWPWNRSFKFGLIDSQRTSKFHDWLMAFNHSNVRIVCHGSWHFRCLQSCKVFVFWAFIKFTTWHTLCQNFVIIGLVASWTKFSFFFFHFWFFVCRKNSTWTFLDGKKLITGLKGR